MAKPQKRAAAAESAASKKKSKVEEEEEDDDDDDDEEEEEAEVDDEKEEGDEDDDDDEEEDAGDEEEDGQKAWNKVEKKVVAMEKEFQAWKKSGGSTAFDHQSQLNICKEAIEEYLSVCCYSGGDDAEAWEERLDTMTEEYGTLNTKLKTKK
jgi:hypothetical protein